MVTWTISKTGDKATLKGKLHILSAIQVAKKNHKLGFTSCEFSKQSGVCYSAGSDGKLYLWNGSSKKGNGQLLHKKMISCLNVVTDEANKRELLITGSADKTVKVFVIEAGDKIKELHSFTVEATPRAVDYMHN